MNTKILIAAHKQCDVPNDAIYLPVHVGKAFILNGLMNMVKISK